MARAVSGTLGLLTALIGGTVLAADLARPAVAGVLASGPPSFEAALLAGCAATLLAGWLWLAATAAVDTIAVARSVAAAGGRPAPAEGCRGYRGCPRLVHAGVLAVLGLGPVLPVLPAYADAAVAPPVTTVGVAGLPLPDRTVGGLHRPVSDRTEVVVVRTGDTLWGLARARLPEGASAAAIDAAWRRIYHANRRVIGDDPDLLIPGTVLQVRRRP